jgi:hypothetical protein
MNTDGNQTCLQWTPLDLSFTAGNAHENPYILQDEPNLRVTFTHAEDDRTLTLEGFWAGGRSWVARFAAPLAGTWTWQSTSPDPGLDGLSGSTECAPVQQEDIARNPNLRGHVVISPDRRHFIYADGTPIFLLGDTNWSLNTVRCGLDANSQGPMATYLNDRRSKGFSAVFTEMVEIDQPNEGGHPYPENTNWPGDGDYGSLNPDYFTSLDRRMHLLWESGFVVAAHPTWIGKQVGMPVADAHRLTRYLLARYGAYNIIWSLSGEYQYAYSNDLYSWNTENWRELGRAVARWNAYGHPVSVHPSGRQGTQAHPDWPPESAVASSAGEFHDEPWLDHNWLQTGHAVERLWRVPSRVAENYDHTPAKPVIHSEGFYENHKPDGATAEQVRYQAWSAFLNGAAGHVYGGAGVWQFHDPVSPIGEGKDRTNSRPHDGTDWRAALSYEGARQLKHLAEFLTSVPWWRLDPCRERIRVDGAVPDIQDLSAPHCAASPDGFWLIHIPSGNRNRSLTIDGFDPAGWSAQWLNPVDGKCTSVELPTVSDRVTPPSIPPLPTDGDWVLYLHAT